MTVFLSRCLFFATVVLPLFGVPWRTTIGTFGGGKDPLITPFHSRLQSCWGAQLALRHPFAIHEGIVKNGGELLEVFVGFRPSHRALGPQDIQGRLGLVILEDEQELLCERVPDATPAS